MSVLSKIKLQNNLIKTSVAFRELDKAILNFVWKHKKLQITKEILKKRERNPEGSIMPEGINLISNYNMKRIGFFF